MIILEGVVDFLDKPVSAFVRLRHSVTLGDLPEVDIPTRFIYLFAAPPDATTCSSDGRTSKAGSQDVLNQTDNDEDRDLESQYLDMGISLATAFTDKNFALEVRIISARLI